MFYLTYEELTQPCARVSVFVWKIMFYLTYEELTLSIWKELPCVIPHLCHRFYLTYEELTQYFKSTYRCVRFVLPYLWGIDTSILIIPLIPKRTCFTLPMRNWHKTATAVISSSPSFTLPMRNWHDKIHKQSSLLNPLFSKFYLTYEEL